MSNIVHLFTDVEIANMTANSQARMTLPMAAKSIELDNNSPYWLDVLLDDEIIMTIAGWQERDADLPPPASDANRQVFVVPHLESGEFVLTAGTASPTFILGQTKATPATGIVVQLIQTSTATGQAISSVTVANGPASPVPTSPQVSPPSQQIIQAKVVYVGDGSTYDDLASARLQVATYFSDGQARMPIGGTGVAATPYSGVAAQAITSATTTALKGSAGVIGTLVNAGSATSGTITIYDANDAASGTILWAGTLTAGQVLPIGMPAANGITVVTASADTLTVSYA